MESMDDRLERLVERFARSLESFVGEAHAPVVVRAAPGGEGGHWVPLARTGGRAVWAVVDRRGAVTALIAGPPEDASSEGDQTTTVWHVS